MCLQCTVMPQSCSTKSARVMYHFIVTIYIVHQPSVSMRYMSYCHAILYVAIATTASTDATENKQKASDYFWKQPVKLKSTTAQCECMSGGTRSW